MGFHSFLIGSSPLKYVNQHSNSFWPLTLAQELYQYTKGCPLHFNESNQLSNLQLIIFLCRVYNIVTYICCFRTSNSWNKSGWSYQFTIVINKASISLIGRQYHDLPLSAENRVYHHDNNNHSYETDSLIIIIISMKLTTTLTFFLLCHL